MKYLVEIIPESITDMEAAVQSLATTLKLDPAKAANLLRRNPITKPVSQAEAEKVARLFTKAGIEVFVRAEDEIMDAPAPIPEPAQQVAQRVDATTPMTENSVSDFRPVSDVPPPTATAVNPGRVTDPGLSSPNLSSPSSSNAELRDLSSVHDPFEAKSVQGEETLQIPSGFFTPVPDGAVTSHSETSSPDLPLTTDMTIPKPQSGLGKIAFASIVPGLLALAGIFTALSLLGLPFLQTQQRASAETAAVSLASSLGSWIGDVSLDNPTLAPQVQNVITRTQGELRGRNVDLVLLSDTEGNQLAGWYKDGPGVPDTVATSEAVRAQISSAIGGAVAATTDTPLGTSNLNTRLDVDGETLGLASATVRQGDVPVGSVVVGVSEQPLMARVRSLLPTLVLAGVLPLLLGILLSLLIGRNRTSA
jgi:hypothetical protein